MEIKHNIFEQNGQSSEDCVITHADQETILANAKKTSVGSFQEALKQFAVEQGDEIAHAFENVTDLFPDAHNIMPGAPELVPEDVAWVSAVINGAQKSPWSRLRTRQADKSKLRAYGWDQSKKKSKKNIGNVTLVNRTTDPQTVYVKDELNRDDVADITDFDVVAYEQSIMRQELEEEVARAILIGDGRDAGAEDHISADHIRPVWTDDELYSIHVKVDFDKVKTDVGGAANATFGEEFYRSEALIAAALKSRKDYKGRGKPAFFCTTDVLNDMLLARDMNGRRIYNTVKDLEAVLNVSAIYTVEDFADKKRKINDSSSTLNGHNMGLLGIMINMSDYTIGSTEMGKITSFKDFDIMFNKLQFLIETRLSGALTRVKSAVVFEEDLGADAGV